MAGPERKATSMNLGLHCLCMREAGSSSLLLDVRGVMAGTSRKRICGAGAALLELQREGLTLLKWRAVALPSCPDKHLC